MNKKEYIPELIPSDNFLSWIKELDIDLSELEIKYCSQFTVKIPVPQEIQKEFPSPEVLSLWIWSSYRNRIFECKGYICNSSGKQYHISDIVEFYLQKKLISSFLQKKRDIRQNKETDLLEELEEER